MREYVKECGYEDLLVPLYGVYKRFSDIDIDSLPSQFMLITNHGSGNDYYEICRNKAEFDFLKAKAKFDKALKTDFSKNLGMEYHYKGITPLLMCEALLEQKSQDRLDDYKVVCSYGKPIAILVCKNRDKGRNYYSTEWEPLNYAKEGKESGANIEKPALLHELLKAASDLSKPLPLARVDFYIVNEKLYFGEITLTPANGNDSVTSEYGQIELGKQITLPK